MNTSRKIGVLFVCLGNICRSPMAEAVFRHLVRQEGLEDKFEIDSAGTASWHTGKPPHEGTQNMLDQAGVSYEGLKARQVNVDDFGRFDYIIAMDTDNESNLKRLNSRSEGTVLKLLDLLPEIHLKDVPDPYYTGNFGEVYDMVTKGCKALLELIRKEQSSC